MKKLIAVFMLASSLLLPASVLAQTQPNRGNSAQAQTTATEAQDDDATDTTAKPQTTKEERQAERAARIEALTAARQQKLSAVCENVVSKIVAQTEQAQATYEKVATAHSTIIEKLSHIINQANAVEIDTTNLQTISTNFTTQSSAALETFGEYVTALEDASETDCQDVTNLHLALEDARSIRKDLRSLFPNLVKQLTENLRNELKTIKQQAADADSSDTSESETETESETSNTSNQDQTNTSTETTE